MKKIIVLGLLLVSVVFLFGCAGGDNRDQEGQPAEEQQQTEKNDLEAITDLVQTFGAAMRLVSLLAPEDAVNESIQEHYGEFVSPALLEKWLGNPANAPGRTTSSPWPDRIEILGINNMADDFFEVKGEIIEVTSVEKAGGKAAFKKPVTIVVKKTGEQWLIDDFIIDANAENETVSYKSAEYGFSFVLPDSWQGYQIVNDRWEGLAIEGQQSGAVAETGPLVSIRHPQWTPQDRRQDIPVMVFTLTQWDALQREEFHIGAAPINPRELGRNSKYIFALPARYNFAFPTGYEEVEDILAGNPLRPE